MRYRGTGEWGRLLLAGIPSVRRWTEDRDKNNPWDQFRNPTRIVRNKKKKPKGSSLLLQSFLAQGGEKGFYGANASSSYSSFVKGEETPERCLIFKRKGRGV